MTDIDCHKEMMAFHREKVTLSNKQQKEMRERRDAGRTRLKNGLDEAEEPQPEEVHSQGSYAMRTMVQDDDNDYDIDDGVYFASDDLTDESSTALTPLAARKRIYDALKWDGRLKREATVMRNCVRQTYPQGYHIDIPVYRIIKINDENGDQVDHYELASGDEWIRSDARSVTRWFNNLVGELNAGECDGSQMRRITKLTKKFSRRTDWKDKTTSGICITKLVVDLFESNTDRDDKTLRKAWKEIEAKLQKSTEIDHPVPDTEPLASEGDEEVIFFRECLTNALQTLAVLDTPDCTRAQAREAWDRVFETDFFTMQPDRNNNDDEGKESAMKVTSVEIARRDDGGGRFG